MGRLTKAWAQDRADYDNRDWLPAYIQRKKEGKRLKHRKASIRLMKAYKGLYDCAECIHGIINSCRDRLPNACEYFSDETTGRRFEQIDETLEIGSTEYIRAKGTRPEAE